MENMQVIIDEAKRLSSLVGDLLDLSRLQSGTSELHMERFDLTDEVEGIIERFSKFSEPEGYTVLFENKNGHILVASLLKPYSLLARAWVILCGKAYKPSSA